MNSLSPEIEEQRVIETRSKTSKKNAKTHAKISKKAQSTFKMKRGNRKGGGIIYIGHIPHGFYEDEMKSYFNQFGKVLATVVARSKKTGRSKGYGFVEFKDEEVAKIAAETMNNYLMFNRIIKCRYIPPEEKRGPIIERKVTAYNFPRQENRKINERQKEEALSKLSQSLYLKKTQAKIDKFKKFFQERGVNFNFQITPKNNSFKGSEEKTKTILSSDSESESKDGTDDEFGVLEIDESESEIYFKTPPQVKKVIKKSLNSSATPVKEFMNSSNRQASKERINLLKKSSLGKTQKKIKQKAKVGVRQKLNKKRDTQEKAEKCLKVKEFKLRKAKVKVNPLAVKNKSTKVRNR